MDVKPLTPAMLCGMQGIATDAECAYWYQRNLAAVLARELRVLMYDPSHFGLRDDIPAGAVLRRLADVADQLAALAELVAGIDIDHDGRLGEPCRK